MKLMLALVMFLYGALPNVVFDMLATVFSENMSLFLMVLGCIFLTLLIVVSDDPAEAMSEDPKVV